MTLFSPLRILIGRPGGGLHNQRRFIAVNSHSYSPSALSSLASTSRNNNNDNNSLLICTTCCQYSNTNNNNYNGSKFRIQFLKTKSPHNYISFRSFKSDASSSSSHSGQQPVLPSIFPHFPPILWPKFTNTLKNFFFAKFVIQPYMDADFSLTDFDVGAREAISSVSQKLSRGEFDDLDELVESSTLEQVKKIISTFSVSQREMIAVDPRDIVISFPYEIGIILPENLPNFEDLKKEKLPPQKRFVEITVVYHVMKGKHLENPTDKTLKEFMEADDTKRRTMVVNCRFFRDFTEGQSQESSWIIKDMLNFFLAVDLTNRNVKF